MWLGLDLGLGLGYRVKVGIRVRASVLGWGLIIGVSPCFWMMIFTRLFVVKGLVYIFDPLRGQK
jgi:hypothetical protein